jgi:hypothetical protein
MASDADQKIAAQNLGPLTSDELSHVMGWDTTRIWANSVQVFLNAEQALFVLREGVAVEAKGEGDEEPAFTAIQRNVGSFVLPLRVAKELRDILQRLDFDAAENDIPK